jgi:hypothetical protein
VSSIYSFQANLATVVWLALFALKMWALVDAVLRPAQGYLAADKLTKAAWLWILGLALATQLIPLGLTVSLIGVVAAAVYIVDVKPAIAALTRRR